MIDNHTHTPHPDGVYNLTREELHATSFANSKQILSAGIHPWWVTPDWETDFQHVVRWGQNPQVLWIGETGLDKLKGPDLALQREAFKAHINLSEELKKPLIIHCVKAIDELLALKKLFHPEQIWMFHGFRGKPQQMQQLIKAGIHISFGAQFNAESLHSCPTEFRHIETDDSGLSLEEVLLLQKSR